MRIPTPLRSARDDRSGNICWLAVLCSGHRPSPGREYEQRSLARLPFLVISPYAKSNYVDHSVNDTTSILRFIEYHWGLGPIGDPPSFDVLASGSILGMFDFDEQHHRAENRELFLDPTTGESVAGW